MAFAQMLKSAASRLAGEVASATAAPARFKTAGLTPVLVDASAHVPGSCVITGNALVSANVTLGERVVIKAATQRVELRPFASIGESAVLSAAGPHAYSPETGLPNALVVGSKAVVGKRAVLSSCVIEEGAVLGDDVVVEEGSVVGKGALLDAGTVVPRARYVPAGEHWGGAPAKFLGSASAGHH